MILITTTGLGKEYNNDNNNDSYDDNNTDGYQVTTLQSLSGLGNSSTFLPTGSTQWESGPGLPVR